MPEAARDLPKSPSMLHSSPDKRSDKHLATSNKQRDHYTFFEPSTDLLPLSRADMAPTPTKGPASSAAGGKAPAKKSIKSVKSAGQDDDKKKKKKKARKET